MITASYISDVSSRLRRVVSEALARQSRVLRTGVSILVRWSSPIRMLMVCGVLAVALIAVGTGVMAGYFRERALMNREFELQNSAMLLARHLDQQFEQFEYIQTELIVQIREAGIDTADDLRREMSTYDTHRTLNDRANSFARVGELNLFDPEGILINSSRSWPVAQVNVADREYFKRFKSNASSPTSLIEPVQSRITGAWTIVLARKIVGRDGRFLGAVGRGVEPAHFETFFSSLQLRKTAAIALFHRDGTLLSRHPVIDGMVGKNFKSGPLFQRLLSKADHGTLRLDSRIDGQDRIVSARSLKNLPIVVVVAQTTAEALEDWRLETRFLLAVAIVSGAVVMLILALIVRRLKRDHERAAMRLALGKQRLDIAVDNMTQGLLLFDSSERLVVCNTRYIELYGLSPDVVKPGCSLRELFAHREESGSLAGGADEHYAAMMNKIREGVVTETLMETTDGRRINIVHRPLPEGGWVSTHEEITERWKMEQERDRNHAFLHQIIDHIPSQITVKNAGDRRYVLFNRVAEKQFGTPRNEAIGKTAYDYFPREAADRLTAEDDKALQSADGMSIDEHAWKSPKLGDRFITSKRINIRDRSGGPQYLINIVEDVTERKLSNDRILHQAHYDALTDLPNRVLFREQLVRMLMQVGRGQKLAVLYFDLDQFKSINDTLGHPAGDELLKIIAERLRSCVRETDFVARLGGDEFAIIQTGVKALADTMDLVHRITDAIRAPFQLDGHQLFIDTSIGIAMAPGDGTDPDQLLKNADLALYGVKSDGRGAYRFFEPEMDARVKARRALELDLRCAIDRGELELHYQPLVNLQTDKISGCEALLRWRHPDRGMISPMEFIPIAEESGFINQLGEWTLRTACMEAATWPDDIKIAVNVSPVQFRSETLTLTVAGILAASGLSARRLELEITEAVLIRDDEAALGILRQLQELGVRIALDDFGTGYSSLSYLQRFPFDKIKVDRSFINGIEKSEGSLAVVQAVVDIAKALNMTTTAEGIETEQQRELVRSLGYAEMQGYLFSRPKPAGEIRQLFSSPGVKAGRAA